MFWVRFPSSTKLPGQTFSISSFLLAMFPSRSTNVRRIFRALGGIDMTLPSVDRTMRSTSKS